MKELWLRGAGSPGRMVFEGGRNLIKFSSRWVCYESGSSPGGQRKSMEEGKEEEDKEGKETTYSEARKGVFPSEEQCEASC